MHVIHHEIARAIEIAKGAGVRNRSRQPETPFTTTEAPELSGAAHAKAFRAVVGYVVIVPLDSLCESSRIEDIIHSARTLDELPRARARVGRWRP